MTEIITDRINQETFEAGVLVKVHGVSGEVILRLNQQADDLLDFPEWVFIRIWSQLVPYQVEEESVFLKDSRHLVLGLSSITTQENARSLIGNACFLQGQWDDWFQSETETSGTWIGATVTDSLSGQIGTVTGLSDIPGNPLIEILIGNKTILLPFNDDYILESDKNTRKLHVSIPPEFWDI